MKTNTLLSLVGLAYASQVSATCFSTDLGYPCCSEGVSTIITDNDGPWGIENGEWCGISESSSSATCWSAILGYECCKESNTNVVLTDNDGSWGVENGEWCGIQVSEELPGSDRPEMAQAYMNKMELTETFPNDVTVVQPDVTTYGTVTKKSYFSTTTNTDRFVNVVLPANYTTEKKYPVLYLLHGILGNEDSLLKEKYCIVPLFGNLVNLGKSKEMIIVVPNEYAPAEGTAVEPGYYKEYYDGYDNFINDLIHDLMPFIQSNFSVASERDNTAIAGFSMGGRNALYIGYSRPDLFGYVAAFSPAPGVTPGSDIIGDHPGLFSEDEFRIHDEKYTPYITYISTGTNDTVVGEIPESYHDILTRNGQPHVWMKILDAQHEAKAVIGGLYNLVPALFGLLGF